MSRSDEDESQRSPAPLNSHSTHVAQSRTESQYGSYKTYRANPEVRYGYASYYATFSTRSRPSTPLISFTINT